MQTYVVVRDHNEFQNKSAFASSVMWFIFSLQKEKIHLVIDVIKKKNTIVILFCEKWYLLELCRLRQAWTKMSDIFRHTSLIYWSMCPNMPLTRLVWWALWHVSHGIRPNPLFPAQAWPQYTPNSTMGRLGVPAVNPSPWSGKVVYLLQLLHRLWRQKNFRIYIHLINAQMFHA